MHLLHIHVKLHISFLHILSFDKRYHLIIPFGKWHRTLYGHGKSSCALDWFGGREKLFRNFSFSCPKDFAVLWSFCRSCSVAVYAVKLDVVCFNYFTVDLHKVVEHIKRSRAYLTSVCNFMHSHLKPTNVSTKLRKTRKHTPFQPRAVLKR